jgi:hypothetical protein
MLIAGCDTALHPEGTQTRKNLLCEASPTACHLTV